MRKRILRNVLCSAASLLFVTSAHATWSIVIVDRVSKEVAIGSATCLFNFDLLRALPVIRVDVGAAAAQALVDGTGRNRRLIFAALGDGFDPNTILHMLDAQDTAHQSRQYGIVDIRGRTETFSGRQNGAFANGLTGEIGRLTYSIQGNVITGQAVLDEAERAIRETPGSLPDKLMAGMEAARAMGGDGRCSCRGDDPTGCGTPPDEFVRSAWVGFMVVTRRGDQDGANCVSCGDYFMKLNVANVTSPNARDPVLRLQNQFNIWRAATVGIPDAVESSAALTTAHMLNDGTSTSTLRINIRDWQQLPAVDITSLTVTHDNPSGAATIGPVSDLGGGVYELTLGAGTTAGSDRLAITVGYVNPEDPNLPDEQTVLIPSPRIVVQDARADFDKSGVVDLDDLSTLLLAFTRTDAGDVNGDGRTDLFDLAILLTSIVVAEG